MAKNEKDGFFKRLFGAKNSECCCGVKIEEIEEVSEKDTDKETSPEGCCKQAQKS